MTEDNSNNTSENEVNPSPEQTTESVDLAAEASNAAATEPKQAQKIRSLDELDLQGDVRRQIESYVSKAINDAVTSHDQKQQKKLDAEGFMNRGQIEELMAERDAEYQRRDQAKENLLTTLGSEGITPGSDEYMKVQEFFQTAVADGRITPQILLSEAGIRTVVAMSGVTGMTDAGPGSGAPTQASEMRIGGDGELQMNPEGGRTNSLDAKMREAMADALKKR